ncbi:MAG: autotransporter domain-containing protein [Roseovarius sp.]
MTLILRAICVVFLAVIMAGLPRAAEAQPAFSKVFSPNEIAPGGTSTLIFTINNSGGGAATDLAFTDTFPAGLTLNTPANATNNCGDGTLTAADGGNSVSFANGRIAPGDSCTLSVVVTASAAGVYTNTSGDLTSSAGNSGPATDNLEVDGALPTFSKSATPNPTNPNDPFTVTYLIDNTANASGIATLSMSENFPTGVTVAPVSNLSTTCGASVFPPNLTAASGSSTLNIFANGFNPSFPAVPANGSCTITVDLVADSFGSFELVSGDLSAGGQNAGPSRTTVVVNAPANDGPTLFKRFAPGSTGPGGTVQLVFDIVNASRDDAVGIAFSDDLNAMLAGTLASNLPSEPCGPGSAITGTSTLSFSGGALGTGESCVFSVDVAVPGAAAPATYTNTTSALTATVNGTPFTGAVASDTLEVTPGTPLDLDVSFVPNTVVAGGMATVRYTITNPNPSAAATDVAFDHVFTGFGSLTASTVPGTGSCGAGSSISFTPSFNPPPPSDAVPASLSLSAGSVPAGGSCTFDLVIDLPGDLPGGNYPTQTSNVTSDAGAGSRGSDTLSVNGGVSLAFTKAFTGGPVNAGDTTTLEFTIASAPESPVTATSLSFSDDLEAMLTGTTVTGAVSNTCGGMATSGFPTGNFGYAGGSVAPGASCTIAVTVQTPAGAATGDYLNTASALTGTAGGNAVGDDAATATLRVLAADDQPVILSKEFIGGPFLPGEIAPMRFTIENPNASNDATNISFTDSLSAMLSGATVVSGTGSDLCGSGSILTGTTFLIFAGGTVPASANCTFDVNVQIPGGAASGTYNNVTGTPAATVNGASVTGDPAIAPLVVEEAQLELTKTFTDDPVTAGGTVTLEIEITNPTAQAVSALSFTDNLQSMVAGTSAVSTPTNSCGGTAAFPGNNISYSGGSVPAGGSCTYAVTLFIPAATATGSYPNTISDLSGTIGGLTVTAPPATTSLQVIAVDAPGFAKAFAGPVFAGGTTNLVFTINNSASASALSGLGFTDDLNAMLSGAVASGAATSSCGGSVSGTGFVTFSGGAVGAGSSCTITIPVTAPAGATAGSYPNTSSDLFASGVSLALPATANLTVEPAPGFAKAFSPASIVDGAVSTLTFTIDNSASALAASNLGFTDNFPAGITVATPSGASTTCTGGTLTAVSGTAVASYTGGTVAAGASCTLQVDVTTTTPGTFNSVSGDLTSLAGNSGTASATLTATASADLSVSITDAPDPVFPNQTLTYTVEVSNAGPSTATGVTSSFTLPAGVTLTSTSGCAEDPNGVATCTLGDIADGASDSYTITVTVDAASTGTLNASTTVASPVADPAAGNNTATAATTVTPQADISVTKTDGVTSIRAGDTLSYTIVASNAGPSTDPSVSLTDTFPGTLTCTYTSAAAGGATGNTASGAGDLAETLSLPSGGSVTYTAMCTVDAAATGTLSNTATVTASVDDPDASNNSATDSDTVVVVPSITFTKAFLPAAIEQGETTQVVITIDNSLNALPADTLTFTDNFPADMFVATPANANNTCGGSFTANPTETSVALSGGSVAIGGTCTVEVDVVVNSSETSVTNTTTTLTSTLPTAAAASATLSVNPAGAPNFSKVFGPTTIEQGEITTLSLIIDNAANAAAADNLAFSDPFPAGMVVASPANVTNTCGGTFTANGGEASVGLTGGSVIAGEGCTIEVDVLVTSSETSVTNTTTTLTSTLPEAAVASATLTINPAGAPGFSKAFTPDTIEQGGVSMISFIVDNTANSILAGDMAFNDPFPAGMAVAAPANVTSTCGGTFTANSGETSVSLLGGELEAGNICQIDVDVVVTSSETSVTNTTSVLSSTLPDAAAASATLNINPAVAPGFTKAFTPDTIEQGEVTTISFGVDNAANSIEITGLTFNDPFPAGMAVASPANVNTTCGGTFTANAGEASVALADGTLGAGATCTIEVDVVVTSSETSVVNTTSALSSSLPEAAAASATLNINPAVIPGFAKVFAPDVINQGASTTLTLSVDNSANAIEAADLAFTDNFPAGLVIAAPAGLSNTCGGTVTAASGTASLVLANGTVAAGGSCAISVSVQGLTSGTFDNTTTTLATSLGTAPAASDRLTVNAQPLGLSASFAPSTIEQFQTSTLIYSFSNAAAIEASAITLSDTLPAGVTIATPAVTANTCGGTLSAPDGGSAVALSGGTLAPGGSCSISVAVTTGTVGSFANTIDAASSSLGTSSAASATLVVDPATTGRLTIVQNTDTDGTFVFSSTTANLNFTITTAGGTGREGPITLAAGTYVLNQATPEGVGNSAITCTDGDSSGEPRQRTLTVTLDPLEALTCTFTSISSRQKTVDTINRFLTKRADLILSSEPSNNRRFNRLKRGVGGSTPLTFANGNLNSFLPFTAQVSTASESYSLSTSFLQMREAAGSLALAHGDQRGIRHVENYRWDAWFEAQYKKFDAGADTGHFAIAYFGADYLVTSDLLVGAMFQIDDMEDRSSTLNSSVNGTGWMVGPYMTARIGPNLYFDGRVAAGTSTNDISPFNTYTDEFTTDRWMAMAGVTGEYQAGSWTIQPGASLSYFEEKQNSYIDGVGVLIPSQVVSLGQIKIGPTFTGQFQTNDGTSYAPYMSLDAIYNFGDTKGVTVTNLDTASTDGWRGRVQAGVDFNLKGGTSISLGGSYDGIFRNQLDVWGLNFELNIPIHKDKVK